MKYLLITAILFLSFDVPTPSRLTCAVVNALYRHYSKEHYTLDQMKDYLRFKGFSETRITEAEKCIK